MTRYDPRYGDRDFEPDDVFVSLSNGRQIYIHEAAQDFDDYNRTVDGPLTGKNAENFSITMDLEECDAFHAAPDVNDIPDVL